MSISIDNSFVVEMACCGGYDLLCLRSRSKPLGTRVLFSLLLPGVILRGVPGVLIRCVAWFCGLWLCLLLLIVVAH